MSKQRARAISVLIPLLFTLAGCGGPNLQEDPRHSKYAGLLEGKREDAVKKLDQDLAAQPGDLQALYYRATIEVEKGNLEDGIQRLSKLLEKYPSYSFAYSERARANWKAGHYDDAVADANLAIHYRPDVTRNYIRRAAAYLALHKPEQALADLQQAQKLDPKEDRPYVELLSGRCLIEQRKYEQALPVLTQAVKDARKDDIYPFIHRSICYAHLKDWKNAKADSDTVYKMRPQDPGGTVLRAAILSATGHREEARKILIPALKGTPDKKLTAEMSDLGSDVPSVADVAAACLANDDPKLAKSILTLVEARRPLDPEEIFALAKAELGQKDLFRASKLLNQCLAMQPTWVEPRVELIRLYERDGLPQKARAVQKEGLELNLPRADRQKISSAI